MEKPNNHTLEKEPFHYPYKTTTLSNICGTFVRKSSE